MSQSYYGIVGIGINIEEYLDKELGNYKMMSALMGGTTPELIEEEFVDGDYWEVLQECLQYLYKGHYVTINFDYTSTGDMDSGHYIMYYASYPWLMSDAEKKLSYKDIESEIVKAVGLLFNVQEAELKKNVENVNTVGCS